jgi:hypothetical protein
MLRYPRPPRPGTDMIAVRVPVSFLRQATDCLVNLACIGLLYRMRLGPGVEREHVERNAWLVCRLAHWLARLVEDEP